MTREISISPSIFDCVFSWPGLLVMYPWSDYVISDRNKGGPAWSKERLQQPAVADKASMAWIQREISAFHRMLALAIHGF
jgi:hypothetical protein